MFLCEVCRLNSAGREYIGHINTTVSGKQCQRWASNTPHIPRSRYTDARFPDGSRAAAENYCRNPDPSWPVGVWCYTMDPDTRWEGCDVPVCGKSVSAACADLLINVITHQKLGQSGLLFGSNSPAEKSGRESAFTSQLSFTAMGWDACCL